MSESVWARLRIREAVWREFGIDATDVALFREAADRGEALERDCAAYAQQAAEWSAQCVKFEARIEELEAELESMLGHADDGCEECRRARAVLEKRRGG